jgi:hypothetical protein
VDVAGSAWLVIRTVTVLAIVLAVVFAVVVVAIVIVQTRAGRNIAARPARRRREGDTGPAGDHVHTYVFTQRGGVAE